MSTRAGVAVERAAPSACASKPARIEVVGIRFDNVTMGEAVERIAELVAMRRPAYVVTPNLDHVVRVSRDADYAALVAGADLVLADGQPVIWASRLLGRPLRERVAGSDLLPALCAAAVGRRLRLFFLGGAPGAAEAARDVLVARHPGLQIVGVHCPPYGFERDAAERECALEAVRNAAPDVVFVGLGSPKQEQWIVANQDRYGPAVSIGVGISFSFVAGQVRRAPRWMQRCGLEWLHRLVQEPGRLWRRYLVGAVLLAPLVVKDALRRGSVSPRANPEERNGVKD